MNNKRTLRRIWIVAESIFLGFMAAQFVAFIMLVLFFGMGLHRPDKTVPPILDWGCTAIVVLTLPVVAFLLYQSQTSSDLENEGEAKDKELEDMPKSRGD